ncbi:septal ring lytic transglycosylase RlpA family protein [Simplicispira psychrophila]|uniref:septal ring lytic transglycosylase RlpA family protein n=1 Tax=Simplicispira psychrophila TaxID=80882 RepID=UPI00068B9D72
MASWYGAQLHQRRTASGEPFDMHALTAAHPRLPFGTKVCVRSLVTGKVVVVRINDRGPHGSRRIIDLSRAAAKALGLLGRGTKPVVLTSWDRASQACPPA